MVKSVYLSVGRYDTLDKQSQYASELRDLAKQIRDGREVAFDLEDLSQLANQKAMLESVSMAGALRYLARVLLPGILVLLLLIAVLIVLKLR